MILKCLWMFFNLLFDRNAPLNDIVSLCFILFDTHNFVYGGIWLSHGVAYLCRQAKWIGAWIQWMLKLWLQYSCESRSRSSHVWTGTLTEFSFFIGEVEGRAQKTTQKCTWKQRSKKIEPNFFLNLQQSSGTIDRRNLLKR
jgi:hypothetical protein